MRSRRRILAASSSPSAVGALALALLLASCGGGGDGGSGPPPETPVAAVDVAPVTASLVPGHTLTLVATTRDAAGHVLSGRTVAWATSDSKVATVASSGPTTAVLTAVAPGPATITASAGGKSATVTVAVSAVVTNVAFASVVAGGAHSCALSVAGSDAYCWGRGESGQLGVPAPATQCATDAGSFPCSKLPIAVGTAVAFDVITAGGAHSCGLLDGTAYCWGSNSSGQLGDGTNTNRDAPQPVTTTLSFATIDAGAEHTCALTIAGRAYCWGRNDRGQIGDGSTTQRTTPTLVATDVAFQSIAAGGFSVGQTCALTSAGAVYCWGDNERGQLGIGSADANAHPFPTRVTGGIAFSALTVGLGRHACGLTSAGAAYCWGENSYGALGDGTTTDSPTPVAVAGTLAFTRIAAGGFIGHTCGLTATGAAYCWGDNERGAVGDGTNEDRLTPTAVAGGYTFGSIDAGFRHSCARTTAGTVYCWGSNFTGQLGDGSTTSANAPVRVANQP